MTYTLYVARALASSVDFPIYAIIEPEILLIIPVVALYVIALAWLKEALPLPPTSALNGPVVPETPVNTHTKLSIVNSV